MALDPIERLLALREIGDLIARYSISFDDQDWETFAELWTQDAAFVVEGEAFEGREVMLEFLMTCLPDGYRSKHMNSTPLIELAPDGMTAHARTDVVWIAQNFEITIVGRYNDTFVRRDGRWLFSRREETPVKYIPGPAPMSAEATRVSGATMRG